ncbi:MAG: thiol-disulfide oxidoreductase DCC family protein [Chitinophagales bacterium]
MRNKPTIFFDGVCNLCNSSVQFVLKHEKQTYFSFASLQSEFGQAFLKENELDISNFDSIILFENGKIYTKSTAAIKICKQLKMPYSWIGFFIILPKFIRDFVYNFIAKNRYVWFGKSEQCAIPTIETKKRFLN